MRAAAVSWIFSTKWTLSFVLSFIDMYTVICLVSHWHVHWHLFCLSLTCTLSFILSFIDMYLFCLSLTCICFVFFAVTDIQSINSMVFLNHFMTSSTDSWDNQINSRGLRSNEQSRMKVVTKAVQCAQIQMWVLGHLLVRLLVRSHHSHVRWLCPARALPKMWISPKPFQLES